MSLQLPLFAQIPHWLVTDSPPEEKIAHLSMELGIQPLLGRILAARGYDRPDQAHVFLFPDRKHLRSPLELYDMDRLLDRLMQAIRCGEPLRICGDYDVDGVSATAIMLLALRQLGADVDYWLPHRIQDGYGLSPAAVEQAETDGRKLLITVDNGISAFEAAERALQLSVDLLITDHHLQTSELLPPASAVVNPSRLDCPYPFPGLTGAAVAWKVIDALYEALGKERPWPLLAYACLGIVADVAPLHDENRIMVSEGMRFLREQPPLGLQALFRQAGLQPQQVNSRSIAFVLAPRLNAAGRMGAADLALELLVCQDPRRAEQLAAALEQENKERMAAGEKILQEARLQAAASGSPVIALADQWHLGVLGIVAARLSEESQKPVLLAGHEDEAGSWLRGSARSPDGFDITAALARCSELLDHFGGHAGAAGFRLRSEQWPHFCERLRQIVDEAAVETPVSRTEYRADCTASLEEITPELVDQLKLLEPFGEGNPEPVLLFRDLPVRDARRVGADLKHLKLRVGRGWDAIAFRQGECEEWAAGGVVDLLATPRWNEWQGARTLQLEVQALRPSASCMTNLWRNWLSQAKMEVEQENPDREALVQIYKALRGLQQRSGAILPAGERLYDELTRRGVRVSESCLGQAMQIWSEIGLAVAMQRGGEPCWVLAGSSQDKFSLDDSPTYSVCQSRRKVWLDLLQWAGGQSDAELIQRRVADVIKLYF